MKKYIFIILVFLILLWGVPAHSVLPITIDFDNLTADWICTDDDCRLDPGCPYAYGTTKFTACGANYTYGPAEIKTTAARITGTNKRGFRVNLTNEGATTPVDTYLKFALGSAYTLFYIRWYQRDSRSTYTNFKKLFRIQRSATPSQILVPEWQLDNSSVTRMNVWDANLSNNNFFTGYNYTSSTPGTWYCYELKIDLANKVSEFWVNDVSKGTINGTNWVTGWSAVTMQISGNHSREVGGGTIDFDDVVISETRVGCGSTPTTYSVGGTVSGLNGTVVLQNNLTNDISITTNSSYTFSTQLTNGSNYSVTVKTQPTGQTCTVTNGTGTINSANITNANVTCTTNPVYYSIGGVVTGLSGTMVLQNNGGDNKTVTNTSGNINFTFPTLVLNGATYLATVLQNPIGQSCTVTNGSGSVSGANVSSILVSCVNAPSTGEVSIHVADGINTLTFGTGSNTLTWSEVPVVPETIVKLTYFPSVDQDNMYTNTGYNYNCGVRASTEVMGYWTNHGFTNLMTSLPTGAVPDDSTQMQTLFTNMVSYTTYSNYCDGPSGRGQYWYTNLYCYTTSNYPTSGSIVYLIDKLKSYLTLKGYNGTVTSEGALPSFATIKSKIDSGIPVMLSLYVCNHWVTVLGYNITGGLQNLYINIGHDNWSSCSGLYSTATGAYEDEIAYADIPASSSNDAVYIHPAN